MRISLLALELDRGPRKKEELPDHYCGERLSASVVLVLSRGFLAVAVSTSNASPPRLFSSSAGVFSASLFSFCRVSSRRCFYQQPRIRASDFSRLHPFSCAPNTAFVLLSQ